MENQFKQLGIHDSLLKAIQELGFEKPTQVQEEAIPQILKGRDLVVNSKTGSGKTAAFGIPLIQGVKPQAGVQGLVLSPTRELVVQIDKDFKDLSNHTQVKTTAVYGRHSMKEEIQSIQGGAALVTGSPGRTLDHIKRGTLPTKDIKYLVLDEADRMLDMGFIDEVLNIIKRLPKKRVTLLFSATMPMEVKEISRSYMNNPLTVELESDTLTVDTVEQVYYRVERNRKKYQLLDVLKYEQPDSCMLFCNTRREVDYIADHLKKNGFSVKALHGTKTQSHRLKTIKHFKTGKMQILVATDVAARGIHIDDLSLVINYDVPQDKDSYVHRIGRTGRAGNGGRAVALVTSGDLFDLYAIEEHVGTLIEEKPLPTREEIREKMKENKLEVNKKPGHKKPGHKKQVHKKPVAKKPVKPKQVPVKNYQPDHKDKKSKALFNRIAPVYGLFFRRQQRHYKKIIQALESQVDLSKKTKVLDVGCGTGALVSVLVDQGLHLTGVDPAEAMIKIAKRKVPSYRARFLQEDALQGLSFKNNSFDLVFASYVAHGMDAKKRQRLYAEMKRVSKDLVIIHDYKGEGSFFTKFIEGLEGGDYFNFIKKPKEELLDCHDDVKKCFDEVRVVDVGKGAAWYICK